MKPVGRTSDEMRMVCTSTREMSKRGEAMVGRPRLRLPVNIIVSQDEASEDTGNRREETIMPRDY